jgi:NTE family protein
MAGIRHREDYKRMNSTSGKNISLVLGSGGARGLAHIGVIRWLEENGYRIESVSGCSMGALVGGIYGCGKLDEFAEWVRAIDKLAIVRLLDVSVGKGGFVDGDRIIQVLKELVGDQLIENLPIQYTAVAADIVREKEIWIDEGSVFDAIRASISLPLFFTPFDYRGTRLLDGGILNPVPIAPTFKDDTDLTIAVNLGGKPVEETEKPVSAKEPSGDVSTLQSKIGQFIDQFKEKYPLTKNGNWAMLDIVDQTFDAMQGAIARQKLAAYPPDAVIVIPRNACGTLEFDRADEMIELGYAAAKKTLGSAT